MAKSKSRKKAAKNLSNTIDKVMSELKRVADAHARAIDFDMNSVDEELFSAVLTADPTWTTCTCKFAGSSTEYLYLIPVDLAADATVGDYVVVDCNHHDGYAMPLLTEIHDIPQLHWSTKTRSVLAIVPQRELVASKNAIHNQKASLYMKAEQHLKEVATSEFTQDRAELQEHLGLRELFNNDEETQ